MPYAGSTTRMASRLHGTSGCGWAEERWASPTSMLNDFFNAIANY
ncbi:MAG: hypothetical protein OEZ57_07145 [Nitrospirota bacterium]|nr:hypothetical protein [Nitrospirota bacterium]